jgi:hypothetical protein
VTYNEGNLRSPQEVSWDERALFIDFGVKTCPLSDDGSESDSRGALDGGNPLKSIYGTEMSEEQSGEARFGPS